MKYDDSSSYLIVMNNGKMGVYKDDKELIEQNYQNIIYSENSNIFVVRRNSNYGIFSTNGDEILGVKYSEYSLAGDYISVELSDGTKELYDVYVIADNCTDKTAEIATKKTIACIVASKPKLSPKRPKSGAVIPPKLIPRPMVIPVAIPTCKGNNFWPIITIGDMAP